MGMYSIAKHANDMVDKEAIIWAMKAHHYTYRHLSAALGISENSVRNKLAFGTWDLVEAYRLSKLLRLDIMKVFFAFPQTVQTVDTLIP